jgi:protease-4
MIQKNSYNNDKEEIQTIKVIPKLNNFLITFILFSLPGFLTSLIWLLLSIFIFFATVGAISSFNFNNVDDFSLETNELQSGPSRNTILVYNLSGEITSSDISTGMISINKVRDDFRKIKQNKEIKNVVFQLNTPGGEVFASKVLGDLILDLTKHLKQEQSVFYFNEVSASGGLMAAYTNNQNYIVASPHGETGSIGVLIALNNFTELSEKVGFEQIVFESGDLKGVGNPFQALSQTQRNYIQEMLNNEFNAFKNVVEKGRGLSSQEVDVLATGEVFANPEAKEKGLIDEIGSLDLSIQKAASNSDLKDYRVIETKDEISLVNSFFAKQSRLEVKNILNFSLNALDKDVFRLQNGVLYAIDQRRI